MKLAQSRVTSQGQVSVPAEVRRRLGLAPGSVLEWEEEEDGTIVVRRARRFSSEDIHRALFPDGPPEPRTLAELKAGIAAHMVSRYARR
ncbi:MAG: AbrB/MazE/SpoVT family DNA-binding domain-containing protein [Polyangiaceae bacterium]